MNLQGIFPPIPTPFEQQRVALDRLQENVVKLLESGINGVVALGSNGENASLTRVEKIAVVEHIRKSLPDEKLLIAGASADAYPDVIEMVNTVAECGANAALIHPPVFFRNKLTDEGIVAFYHFVADHSRIPILLYNVPKYCGYQFSLNVVQQLATHDNIIGLKNSTEHIGYFTEVLQSTPAEFKVLAGTASILLPALLMGAHGGIVALANIAPDYCLSILSEYQKGNIEKAREAQQKIMALNKALTSTYGIAGLKAAMDMLGFFGREPRLPLVAASPQEKAVIRDLLIKAELI
jgi:4-hydroxy-2-oxoglutarate aldolase